MNINREPQRAGWGQTKTRKPNVCSNSTPIFVNNKRVGFVRGQTFYKTLSSSKHFLRIPPAIAFDVASLKSAWRAGARVIEIVDRDTNQIYRAAIRKIRRDGFCLNRGYGQQLALLLVDFETTDGGGDG